MSGGREERQPGIKSPQGFLRTDGAGDGILPIKPSWVVCVCACMHTHTGAPQKQSSISFSRSPQHELEQQDSEGEERAGTN